jgi:hypothetical protein
LERFPGKYRNHRVKLLPPVRIEKMVGEKAATLLNTIRAMLQFWVAIGNLPQNPATREDQQNSDERVRCRNANYPAQTCP